MRLNIIPQIKNIALLIIGFILTFAGGCENEINNPEISKDYLKYRDVVKEGLIAFYPFDGNAKDWSGNGYDGVENSTSASVGRFGQEGGALKFDGVKTYIEIPYFADVNGDNGTICFWIKTRDSVSAGKQAAVISKIDTVGMGYVISVYDLYDYWFEYKIPHLRAADFMRTVYRGESEYQFIAVTFSIHKLTYYYQGKPTMDCTINGGFVFNNNKQALLIGKSRISEYVYFKGEIDDLLIYNRELSKDEILKLYNWK